MFVILKVDVGLFGVGVGTMASRTTVCFNSAVLMQQSNCQRSNLGAVYIRWSSFVDS